MEIRNENIVRIEKYKKGKKIFFDDLLKLTENVPSYLKNTHESINLSENQYIGEFKMNSISKLNTPEEILLFIKESHGLCISKEIIINCFNLYKIKTWNQAIKYKLYVPHAESLLEESESLKKIEMNEEIDEKINNSDIEELSKKVKMANNWINKTKQFLVKKEKTLSDLINIAKESEKLPLLSDLVDKLIEFKNNIENNINEIKKIKNEKKDFKIIVQLYKNFNNNKFIDNEEYNYIKSLYDFGLKWTENAKKIINSRQLCQLYFKNKVPLEDGTIIETKGNIVDILANQKMDNNNKIIELQNQNEQNINNYGGDLFKSHKFILGENQFIDNDLTAFLSKKRSHENSNNDNDNLENDADKEENKENKKIIIDKNNISLKEKNIDKNLNTINNNNIINIDENTKKN